MKLKYLGLCLLLFLCAQKSFAQGSKRFSVEANYGINYNFFVTSYNEDYAPGNAEHLYLYKKKQIGTVGGLELKYRIGKHGALFAGYARTVNSKRRSGGILTDDFQLYIEDFNLRHINNIYLLGYERPFSTHNPTFRFNFGLLYMTSQQQEITIDKLPKSSGSNIEAVIRDRNKKNAGMEEAGVFAGFSYQKPISNKFDLGIKTRGYFLVSTGTFESITLTPLILYKF